MGQGYSFFAVIVFEASSFVPAWLKRLYLSCHCIDKGLHKHIC